MTRGNLIKALTIYEFFPTVKKLVEFFDAQCDTKKLEWHSAKVDNLSGWDVPTEERWVNHNDWTKNLPKFGDYDFTHVGSIFTSIVDKIKKDL